ncbi:PBSX family phage terminase large subunit [Kitasatospora sp. McL0602]|uniref:PBSX family phage terminase large subunit n=1 Tax=Kitasatospora sp. McL0602 TaxID=3439530 RepID=UPI003F88B172
MLRNVQLPLSRKQIASIVEAQHRINCWEGSVRSGKTVASLLRWLGYVADAPRGGELVMVGRTRDSINRNIFGPLQNPDLLGPLARQVHYTNGAPTAQIMGQTVHVLGANDAQAEPKVRGMTCAGAYADEVTTLPEKFFDQLVARCSVPGAKIFATTNPDNPAHWFRKKYLLRPAATRLRSWHFTLDDNPSLDPEYAAALKSTYTGLFYRRNILGEWVQAEGSIYDMWNPDEHVVDKLPPMQRLLSSGIDYGTVNPFAGLLLGLGIDGRLYVTSEYRHDSRAANRQLTDAQYSKAVRSWLTGQQPEWLFIDPSAASFMTQLWADGLTNVAKADNAVLDGIRSVSMAIGSGLLFVHRSCSGLLDELPGYAWDDAAAAKGEDKPIKVNDHSVDALRYALHSTVHGWRHLLRADLTEAA